MRKFFSKALVVLSAALAGGTGYMLFEAAWLKLQSRSVNIPGLPPALDGFKLLHISDIHAGAPGPGGMSVLKIAGKARQASPDIVLFTGDMTDKKKDITPYLKLLSEIQAPLGKFAVLGNHDHGLRKKVGADLARRFNSDGSGRRQPTASKQETNFTVSRNRKLLEQAGIRLLENECAEIGVSGQKIQICGVDDYQYGYADLPAVARQIDEGAGLRVLLSHSPDIVEAIPNGDYHLVLSGHTHGGQICIPHPTKGKILLSTSGSRFGSGIYSFPHLTMHVSPGVGTTLLPLRLLSRPEITLITLSGGAAPGLCSRPQ